MVTVEADILAPNQPLVLNNLTAENMCIAERDTTVVCFTVSVCFNYSILPEDRVESFSKTFTPCMVLSSYVKVALIQRKEAICISLLLYIIELYCVAMVTCLCVYI